MYTCSECGTVVNVQDQHHLCDGCGKVVCDTCWNLMHPVYTDRPTKQGMTGCIKICRECRKAYKDTITSINEHPYLG